MSKTEEELLLEEINRIIGDSGSSENPEEADDREKDLALDPEIKEAERESVSEFQESEMDGLEKLEGFAETEPEAKEEMSGEEQPSGRKKSSRWTTVALIIGIALLVYAIGNFAYLFWNYHKSNSLYDNLNHSFVTTPEHVAGTEAIEEMTETGTETVAEPVYVGPWYEMAQVDLAGLKAVNSDVVGWLYQENGSISYPIMYSGDNDTYLHAALDKSYAYAGSIFLEGQSNPDLNDSYTIIYGHNMRNLSMFGSLKYYHNSGYYEDHQYFQIFKEDGIYRYHVFAYDIVNCDDEQIYSVPYGDNDEFTALLNRLYRGSEKDTGVEVTSADKVIALSTCSTGDDRFVVHAVLEDVHLYSEETGEGETGTESVE